MENLRVEFICYLFNNIFIYLIICLFSWFFFIGLPNTILFINLSLIISLIPFFLHHFLNFVHVDKTAPAVTPPIVPIIKAPAEFRLEWCSSKKIIIFLECISIWYFFSLCLYFTWLCEIPRIILFYFIL